jgi:hypothetical protein
MTAADIRSALLANLVRKHGGSRHEWARAMGNIILYSVRTHPHCNWDVRPAGTAVQVTRICASVDQLRDEVPVRGLTSNREEAPIEYGREQMPCLNLDSLCGRYR